VFLQAEGDWTLSDVATGLQNFAICVEMFPLALAHQKSFGWNSFRPQDPSAHEMAAETNLAQKLVDIMNIGDVCVDTFVALKKGPKRNVQAGSFLSMSRREQAASVLKQEWLYKRGEDLAKIWKLRYCCLIDTDDASGLIYFKKNPFTDLAEIEKQEQENQLDLNQELRRYEGIGGESDDDVISLREPKPNQPQLKARGFIDFTDVTDVKPSPKSNDRFVVMTPWRKWHFRCKNAEERDEWIRAIKGIHKVVGGGEVEVVTVKDDKFTPQNSVPLVELNMDL